MEILARINCANVTSFSVQRRLPKVIPIGIEILARMAHANDILAAICTMATHVRIP